MKFSYNLLITFFLSSFLCFSQQTPLNFSDSSHKFTGFSGSGFSTRADPKDASNTVGQFFNDGSNASQGFFIDLSRPVDFSSKKEITLSFYSFDPNSHSILLKFENGSNANVEVRKTFSVPSPSDWINLTFDFSNAKYSSGGASVNATGTYSRLTIFIDEGTTTVGTYLIDNINDGSVATDPNALDVVYNNLVWSDEFNTDGPVDNTKWHHQTIGPNGGKWFNGELQHYTNSQTNSFVSGGFLNIVAKKESITQNGVTLGYSSARLNSKFAFTYGRVDVRAKLPAGNGTWPAIWTLGKNVSEVGAWFQTQGFGNTSWPACGEIDIMEHGLHANNVVSSALHTPSSSGATVNTKTKALPDVANNFHVYSVNWSPNQITFLIDGVGYYTYNPSTKNGSTWPFNLDQFILLNIAMGGFSGNVDASFTQSSMIIDYVRIYQNTLSTEDTFASKFMVYPNPSSNQVYINTNEKIDRIDIYNTLGKTVLSTDEYNGKLNIQSLKAGMYLLRIHSNNKVVNKKIIVE